MEQQTLITRKSLPNPFDDNNINPEVRRYLLLLIIEKMLLF
jgi:hypothetical protein